MPAPNPIQNDFTSSGQIQPDPPKTPYIRPFAPQPTITAPSISQITGGGGGGFGSPGAGTSGGLMSGGGFQRPLVDPRMIRNRPMEQTNNPFLQGLLQQQFTQPYGLYNYLNQNTPPQYQSYLPQLPGWAGYLQWLNSMGH
jgi:hypothetical protein